MAIELRASGVTIKSIGRPENYAEILDDRQEMVQTVGGVIVEDYGHIGNGDKISLSATFTKTDANTVKSWWSARTKARLTLQDGTVIPSVRILIRKIADVNLHETKYKKFDLEFWRV